MPLLDALVLIVLVGVGVLVRKFVSNNIGLVYTSNNSSPSVDAPTSSEPPIVLSPPSPPSSGTVITPSSNQDPVDKA